MRLKSDNGSCWDSDKNVGYDCHETDARAGLLPAPEIAHVGYCCRCGKITSVASCRKWAKRGHQPSIDAIKAAELAAFLVPTKRRGRPPTGAPPKHTLTVRLTKPTLDLLAQAGETPTAAAQQVLEDWANS